MTQEYKMEGNAVTLVGVGEGLFYYLTNRAFPSNIIPMT